jgi:hypothetical protein
MEPPQTIDRNKKEYETVKQNNLGDGIDVGFRLARLGTEHQDAGQCG